jgi:TolC family type I secretion outer membrane protein
MVPRYVTLILVVSLALVGCAKAPPETRPDLYTAPSQEDPPEPENVEVIEPGFDGREEPAPPDIEPRPGMTLAELVDVALSNNPSTRYAWYKARAAAANWGKSRSEYYPTVSGEVETVWGRVRFAQMTGGRSAISLGATLDYLLLDFGGREARVEAARQALMAANWTHDQVLQDVLRDVPQAYYNLLGARAQVKAAKENLLDARTTLEATEARHASGVATISDVLQARSSKSQAVADLASRKGADQIARGDLATVVGWSANSSYTIAREPSKLPVKDMVRDIDQLIEEARSNRPDIGAAQATVRQMEAQMNDAKTLPFPKLNASGTMGYMHTSSGGTSSMYGGLQLQIPIFAGFSMENSLRAARAELEAAKAQLTLKEQDVVKQVWDAYHNFTTTAEQFKAFEALLVSARESYAASLARYRNGAADIVELLNAQNTLASARSQLINSRMGLYSTYAELLHAVGSEMWDGKRY